jgi:hypothetical protein
MNIQRSKIKPQMLKQTKFVVQRNFWHHFHKALMEQKGKGQGKLEHLKGSMLGNLKTPNLLSISKP